MRGGWNEGTEGTERGGDEGYGDAGDEENEGTMDEGYEDESGKG
jgi:hypothetical protein